MPRVMTVPGTLSELDDEEDERAATQLYRLRRTLLGGLRARLQDRPQDAQELQRYESHLCSYTQIIYAGLIRFGEW
jgi:hypothetical protein